MEQKDWYMAAEYREELIAFLCKQQFNFFGTLVFNDFVSVGSIRRWLYRFHQYTDKKILGPKYWQFPAEQRTFFFCFVEHLDTNPHGHLMITAPMGKIEHYTAIAPAVWSKICPAGDLLLAPVVEQSDLARTVCYATKELGCRRNCEEFIISSEFMNSHQ